MPSNKATLPRVLATRTLVRGARHQHRASAHRQRGVLPVTALGGSPRRHRRGHKRTRLTGSGAVAVGHSDGALSGLSCLASDREARSAFGCGNGRNLLQTDAAAADPELRRRSWRYHRMRPSGERASASDSPRAPNLPCATMIQPPGTSALTMRGRPASTAACGTNGAGSQARQNTSWSPRVATSCRRSSIRAAMPACSTVRFASSKARGNTSRPTTVSVGKASQYATAIAATPIPTSSMTERNPRGDRPIPPSWAHRRLSPSSPLERWPGLERGSLRRLGWSSCSRPIAAQPTARSRSPLGPPVCPRPLRPPGHLSVAQEQRLRLAPWTSGPKPVRASDAANRIGWRGSG